MARRQQKTWHLTRELLKASLLQALFVSMACHAAAVTTAAAVPAADATLLANGSDSITHLGGVDLYLDVTLNGTSAGLVHFAYRDGQLWASRANLDQIGFKLPATTPDPVRLDSLQGLHVDYDASRQTVSLVAPLQLLKLTTTVLDTSTNARPVATASPGVLLNYNLYGTYGEHGSNSLSAFTELRAFNQYGVFSTTSLAQDSSFDNGTVDAPNH